MPETADIFDLLIVGGGPAGAAAAIHARRLEKTVVVIEKETFPRARPCAGWIGPVGVALCGELGIAAKKAGAAEFKGLRVFSWDFKKNAVLKDADLSGWTIDRSAFDQALLSAATKAGATARHGVTIANLLLKDDHVAAKLSDGATVAARILLIADGGASATARFANLASGGASREAAHSAYLEFSVDKPAAGVDVAIGSGRIAHLATIVRLGKTVRVCVATRGPADSLDSLVKTLLSAAHGAGVLPGEAAAAPVRRTIPAGVALDMDSHVGKRCLLIGDAGGFVASFSHEGIYPAMKSGCVAAEVAAKALASRLPQDELATFEDAWRAALADYLRMPNTDLSLLMPLVFNNAQMSARVGRAFLLGQAF